MNQRAEANLRDIPMKPYDLLREGLIVFGVVAIAIVILAIIYSSPDYPTVRGQDVAQRQPIAYLKTSANFLVGNSGIDGYGPPYTNDTANAQQVLGIAPANWFGVTIPIDPAQDFILKPLSQVAGLNNDVASALQTYQAASSDQQQAWLTAYLAALDQATVTKGQVQVPGGDYGPVGTLMEGMLNLGRAGLLEGSLETNAWLPFNLDFTRSLLFFQDDVDASVADTLGMSGGLWGISHETGPYPGAWWLWPYTFFYQVPALSTSDNADLQVSLIIMVLFLVTLLAPYIPVINRLPRWLGLYKLIWRDWYHRPPTRQTNLTTPINVK
jgi:hypothetical protein